MSVESFIGVIRRKLTMSVLLRWFLVLMTVCSASVVLVGLYFILNGHSVHKLVYVIAGAVTVLGTLVLWWCKRANQIQAAKVADSFFDLKDMLTTHLSFRKDRGEVFDLQRCQTSEKLQKLDPKIFPVKIPKRLLATALFTTIAAGSMALVPPSAAVLEQQAQEAETLRRTEVIKKELEEEVEELIKSLSDDEKELVKPDELRKWVKELKETSDKREALRSYARLEQKVNKAMEMLDQRKDEALMKHAGLKLQKAQKTDLQELGKELERKDFKEAAKKLEDFKLSKKDLEKSADKKKLDPKDLEKMQKKQLQDQKQKLARLRSMTKRLAEASRMQQVQQNGQAKGKAGKGKPNGKAQGNGQQMDQELAELLEELDEDAEELEDELDQAELDMEECGECDQDGLGQKMDKLDKLDLDLERLRRKLKQMEGKRKMRKRLGGLQKKLGRAQSFANG